MPRLLLLPGLACDQRLWEAQLGVLPASLAPTVTDTHTRFTDVESMAAAVLAEHPGELWLCGASMGGMIAMEAARQAPDSIGALALLGTNASPETPEMFKLRNSAIELFERGEARDVIEFNAGFAFAPTQARDAQLVRRYVTMVLDAGTDQLVRQNRAVMKRPDARKHLALLKCPVLVMCGDSDRLTPSEHSRDIAALVPQARLEMIEDCGHMLTMEKPERVNRALLDWIAGLSEAQ